MKIIGDFVTNSSSANFIFARKGTEFTEEQKKRLLEYIEENYLGRKALSKDASEEEIQKYVKENYLRKDEEEKIREAIKEGNDIYEGTVDMEEAEFHVQDMYKGIWDSLVDGKHLTAIDDDLTY